MAEVGYAGGAGVGEVGEVEMPGIEHSHPEPEERGKRPSEAYGARVPNRFRMGNGFVTCTGCGVSVQTPTSVANAEMFMKKHGKCWRAPAGD